MFSIFRGEIKAKMKFLISPSTAVLLKSSPSRLLFSPSHSVSQAKIIVKTNKWVLPPKLVSSLYLHHHTLVRATLMPNPNKESLGDLPASTKLWYIQQGRNSFLKNCKLGNTTPLLKIPTETRYLMILKNYWKVIGVIMVLCLCFEKELLCFTDSEIFTKKMTGLKLQIMWWRWGESTDKTKLAMSC